MEPVALKPEKPGEKPERPAIIDGESDKSPERPKKIKMKLADGKERVIQHMIATSYWSADGKPISANQMVENLFGELPRFFNDEDELRKIWSRPDTRRALLENSCRKGLRSGSIGRNSDN